MIKQLIKEEIDFTKICQRAIPVISRMDILSISHIKDAFGYGDIKSELIFNYFVNHVKNFNGSINTSDRLKSFGILEHIGGTLFLYFNHSIKSLGKLKYIGGDFSIHNSELTDIGDLERINGGMDTNNCLLKSLGKLKYIGGQTDLEFSSLETLGSLEEVNGSLNLTGSWKLKSLGNLKHVLNNLRVDSTPITLEQTKNIKVGGDVVTDDQSQTED